MNKSNKIAFVVWEILYWNALNHLLKYHLLHGKKSSWKKSSTYFYILGHVVYAMSIRQIRQQHKEKSRNTIKTWPCRHLMWQPWNDATQSMSHCGTKWVNIGVLYCPGNCPTSSIKLPSTNIYGKLMKRNTSGKKYYFYILTFQEQLAHWLPHF